MCTVARKVLSDAVEIGQNELNHTIVKYSSKSVNGFNYSSMDNLPLFAATYTHVDNRITQTTRVYRYSSEQRRSSVCVGDGVNNFYTLC